MILSTIHILLLHLLNIVIISTIIILCMCTPLLIICIKVDITLNLFRFYQKIYHFKYYIDSKSYDTHVEGAGHQLNYSLITKLQSSANIIDRESGDVFFTKTLRPPVAVQAEVLPEMVQGQTKVILIINIR